MKTKTYEVSIELKEVGPEESTIILIQSAMVQSFDEPEKASEVYAELESMLTRDPYEKFICKNCGETGETIDLLFRWNFPGTPLCPDCCSSEIEFV